MSILPSAKPSPRIQNGCLYWYQDDTFDLTLTFDLKDQDGETVNISPTDTISVVFTNSRKEAIKEFEFQNIQNGAVTMDFDEDVTALFQKGNYTYDIYYTGTERSTIADNNKVVVE